MITSENFIDVEDSNDTKLKRYMILKINTYDPEEDSVVIYLGDRYYVVNRQDMKAALDNAVNTGAI